MKSGTIYSLELIQQLKAEHMEKMEQSKERITDITHRIIAPPKKKNNIDLWMHYASTGVSTYNGIMTAVKLYQRIKGNFTQKKKKKKSFFSWR